MTGDRINQSPDQPRLTNVAGSSENLQNFRKRAEREVEARNYQKLQGCEALRLGKRENRAEISHASLIDSEIQEDTPKKMKNSESLGNIVLNEGFDRKLQNIENSIKQIKDDKETLRKQIKENFDFVVHETEKAMERTKSIYPDFLAQLLSTEQKYQALEQQKIRERELKEILKKAKPELSLEVKEAYDQLQDLHRRAKYDDKVSNDEHRNAFEKLLGHLSPETLREHKERGLEFVINPEPEFLIPMPVKIAEDKWQIEAPFPYKYGIRGLMLRSIDLLLKIERIQNSHIPPSQERRVEIASRVFQANFKLGQGREPMYGFPLDGYKQAEKYYKDYKDGIRQAFETGQISKDDPREKLTEIGHAYAHDKYFESIKPPQGIPRIFPSTQPGAWFEERDIWEIHQGQRPVEVESPAFDVVVEHMKRRQQKGENYLLTVNILWDDATKDTKIWVQPFFVENGLTSWHSMNVQGTHSIWAGEVEIDYETKTVRRLKDQSGHYRTFDKTDPGLMVQFALDEFKKRGYDTRTTIIELTIIDGFDKHTLEYKNYKSRTREDLKDSGGRTESERFIEIYEHMKKVRMRKYAKKFWSLISRSGSAPLSSG